MYQPLQRVRRQLAALTGIPAPELVRATDENFDEQGYLEVNRDVAEAVRHGTMASGWHHFAMFGRTEGRQQFCYPATRIDRLRVARRWYELRIAAGRMLRVQRDLQLRLYDLEVEVGQLHDMLELVHRPIAPPPKHLQLRVVGNYGPDFVRSGFSVTVPMLNRSLRRVGRDLTDFASILDFGCGCGRAVFALSRLVPGADLHATDIDEEAIRWLQRSCGELATYTVCPTLPPMPYEDHAFDFAFGISVFTHLPEDMQFAWLAELARVVKPDGYVVLTTHGEHNIQDLPDSGRRELQRTGFLYVPSGYGSSISLPEFYENTFHSHEYIEREWSRYFEVIDIQAPEPGEHQDLVLLRPLR
jgi:SAM-dependent methyltransferase